MKLFNKIQSKVIQKQLEKAGITGIDPESITPDKLQKFKALFDKIQKEEPEIAAIVKEKNESKRQMKMMQNQRKLMGVMRKYQDEIQEILS